MKKIISKEDFIKLSLNTKFPEEILNSMDGTDFLAYMNEYTRIVENLKVTNVKGYSYRLTAPRLYNYYIGYFADLHNVQLKINKQYLMLEKDEEWWTSKIQEIMETIALWTKRILYMNEYERKEERLAEMRKELEKRGLDWGKDESYQKQYNRKLKYEDF